MASNKRILAIEDDADVAELLIMYFEGQGYTVFHSETGQGGIDIARAKLPNLILLDIMLPDMEGFDVCRVLRGSNLTKYIPTIFLTQRNSRADKVSGLELGADDYLTKPFDIEEIRLRVQKSIERATRDHLHEEITGLPSGPMIDEVYMQYNQVNELWYRLDVHINGYSDFRDIYGFLTANDALNLAARVLSEAVINHGTRDDFVGVVEPGYFVIFTFSPQINDLIQNASTEFKQKVQTLYHFQDVDQGHVIVDPNTPQERIVPLMSFHIAAHEYTPQ
ncbi:MAG: response regulator transcription factor [Anaerolineales bacterium]